jgi:peptidoglycan-associated lipoprotein
MNKFKENIMRSLSNKRSMSILTLALSAVVLFMVMLSLLLFTGCSGSEKMTQMPAEEPLETVETPAPEPAAPVNTRPAEEKTAETAPSVPFALQNVYFEFDRYDLTPEALQTLADNARVLKAYPDARIVIEGHCDERGTVEYNLALGDKRAKAAKDYLISLGVEASQITTISYGKERPLDTGHSEQSWAKNRRAEFARR